MVKSSNKCINAAWKRELLKTNSIKNKVIASTHAVGTIIDFEEDCILLDGERIEKYWKPTWRAIKARLKKGAEENGKKNVWRNKCKVRYFENRMIAVIYG